MKPRLMRANASYKIIILLLGSFMSAPACLRGSCVILYRALSAISHDFSCGAVPWPRVVGSFPQTDWSRNWVTRRPGVRLVFREAALRFLRMLCGFTLGHNIGTTNFLFLCTHFSSWCENSNTTITRSFVSFPHLHYHSIINANYELAFYRDENAVRL